MQILEEQNKNNLLTKENYNLNCEIQNLKFQINSFQNNSNSNIYIEMNQLYKQINDLNEKLNRFPFILERNEKMMSIIFASVDQSIHYSIVCKNTDNIHQLEGELYREYPQFSETENYFMCKGKVLNKFHSFESNYIKNGDVIVLNQKYN